MRQYQQKPTTLMSQRKWRQVVGRRFLTPVFMKTPPILAPPPSLPLIFAFCRWLIVWLCYTSVTLLNDIDNFFLIRDLHLSSLSALVPEVSFYVVDAWRSQVHLSFDSNDMGFFSTLICREYHRLFLRSVIAFERNKIDGQFLINWLKQKQHKALLT